VIRGRSYEEAVAMLEYMPYKACEPLLVCLTSAGSNGKNGKGVPLSKQFIAEAYADQGPVMKRFRPRAQGRCAGQEGVAGAACGALGGPDCCRGTRAQVAPSTAGAGAVRSLRFSSAAAETQQAAEARGQLRLQAEARRPSQRLLCP
jgi:large subunit ribosomal protein L22